MHRLGKLNPVVGRRRELLMAEGAVFMPTSATWLNAVGALSSREPTRAPNLVWIAEMRRRRCQTWEASVRVKSTRDAVGG